MKNVSQKADTRIRPRKALLLAAPLLACILITLPGCATHPRTASPAGFPAGFSADPAEDLPSGDLRPLAFRIILDALADPNPRVRVNAIEVVADTGQIRLMPKVHRLLGDPFVPVRFAAALAVGDMQYALAKTSVGRLLKDKDDNVILAACYAMYRLGYPQYADVYRKAIKTKDQKLRANAAFLLGKTGDRNALVSLYWALRDKDSDDIVALNAAESIARLGDERIYPRIWTMLISARWDDRVMGTKAMAALRTREAANALVTMLDDDVIEVRLAAAQQLGALKSTVGESEVRQILANNLIAGLQNKEAREHAYVLAALAIGRIATPPLTRFLPKMLKNESVFVRLAAAEAVLRSADNR
jgi:HEAT repeat protein